MHRHRLRVACILLFISPMLAAAAFPRMHIRHRVLGNGLEVYSVEDHATPTVAIEVWYRVGSKDDPPGRGGFAHFFEHLMFKATAHMPDELLPQIVEDAGGEQNAETRPDATRYHEVIPSNYLRTLLWAEAERMASLNVDAASFTAERDVVKEELRRDFADPYGVFDDLVKRDAFGTHADGRPVLGTVEELDATSLNEVQAFHRMYYRPDNAVLVLVGDFAPKQLEEWVDRYFAPIPRPATPIARMHVPVPPRREDITIRHTAGVKLPAVAVTWLAPSANTPEFDAVHVLATTLDGGAASLLNDALVRRMEIAHSVSVWNLLQADTGLLGIEVKMTTGHDADEGIAAVRKELPAIISKLSDDDIARAKRRMIVGTISARQTNEGKARHIARSVIWWGDAEDVNRDLQRIDSITTNEVRRVAKKYLSEHNVATAIVPEISK